MKGSYHKLDQSHSIWRLIFLIILFTLLVGCESIPIKTELNTRFNSMGGGQHKMVLAVPVNYYDGAIFDRLPDFSLITGVSVNDYRQGDWQGMEVSQSFVRLQTLNKSPEEAHFLNRAFPGSAPLTFRVAWEPGFLTRNLRVQVSTNTSGSNGLAGSLAMTSLASLNAEYVLELPGPVATHNGELRDERTVYWKFSTSMPQTMEATARVFNWPMMISLLFTGGCGLLVMIVLVSNRGISYSTGRSGRAAANSRRGRRPLPPPRRR